MAAVGGLEHGRRQRRDGHRQAEAEHERRGQHLREVVAALVDARERQQPERRRRAARRLISSRGPTRAASAPKRRDSAMSSSVIGSSDRPASNAL